ncbi:MAG: hypothetical protein ABIR47_05735, partial [Candidatus Kapaibacterium sp.]
VFMIIRALSIILLLLAATVLRAQNPDILLSPPEPQDPAFPASAAIQSVARIGSRSLVAWGSTDYGVDRSVIRNVLVMGMLEGSSPHGVPVIFTDTASRPGNVVAVVALGDRFIVFWNDYRVASGEIYYQVIDTSGTLIGAGKKLKDGVLVDDLSVWASEKGSGYTLFWLGSTTTQRSLYSIPLDEEGVFAGSDSTVVTSISWSVARWSAFPDIRVFAAQSGYVGVHEDGRVDLLGRPVALTGLPYYLNADTSVVAVRYISDTLRQLVLYKSLFDTAIVRTIKVRTKSQTLANLNCITRDSVGHLVLFYGRTEDGGNWLGTMARKIILDDNGTILLDTVAAIVARGQVLSTPSRIVRTRQGPTSMTMGCDGTIAFDATTYSTNSDNRGRNLTYDTAVGRLLIDRAGHLYGGDYFAGGDKSIGRDNSIRLTCRDLSSIWVTRDATGFASTVLVHDGSVTIARLVAPAAFKVLNLPQRNPLIFSRNHTLYLSWRAGNNFEEFLLGRLDFSGVSPTVVTDDYNTADLLRYSSINMKVRSQENVLLPISASNAPAHLLAHMVIWIAQNNVSEIFSRWVYHLIPVNGKWVVKLLENVNTTAGGDDFDPASYCHGFDPNTEVSVSSTWAVPPDSPGTLPTRSTYGFLPNSDSVYRSSCTLLNATAIVPISLNESIFFDSTRAIRVKDSTVTASFPITKALNPKYQRLFGNYYLRYSFPAGVDPSGNLIDSVLLLEIYRTDDNSGVPVSSTTLKARSQRGDLFIIQRPGDLALAIGWGSDSGLHVTLLDRFLSVRINDTVVSATRSRVTHPSGVFQGDTLYTAWEDYRNGPVDIYGNATVLTGISGVGDRPEIHIVNAYPSPARQSITVSFVYVVTGPIQIDLFDELGEVVRTFHENIAGTKWDIVLDLAGIHPGAYFIRGRDSRGATDYQKIFVVN